MGRLASRVKIRTYRKGNVPDPEFRSAIKRANYKSAAFAVSDAKRRFAPHSKTGETMESIKSRVNQHFGFSLRTDEIKGLWVEEGTDAHEIEPTPAHKAEVEARVRARGGDPDKIKAKMMWFEGGRQIFAEHVDHPGQEADPFLRPAITENDGIFESFIEEEIADEWRHG